MIPLLRASGLLPFYLILCFLLLGIVPKTWAQQQDSLKLYAEFENQSLYEVIRFLREKYELKIAYEKKLIEGIRVQSKLNGLSVENAFKIILAGTDLTYKKLASNKLIIRKKQVQEVDSAPQITHFSGIIKDIKTGESIPFATICLKETNFKTVSNQDGYFNLSFAPDPTDTLIIRHLGYQTKKLIIIPDSAESFQELHLSPSSSMLKEIKITDGNGATLEIRGAISQVSVLPEKISRLSNMGEEDIFKGLQSLPGISLQNESQAGLHIRGSTPAQNLVLLDGFTIYHQDHFFGYFSTFNSKALKDIQVYKGGFDSKFGGRSSAVVQLTGKSGNKHHPTASARLNFLSTSFIAETPLNDRTTLLLSTRRAYTDIIQSPLYQSLFNSALPQNSSDLEEILSSTIYKEKNNSSFYYFDLNSKLTYKPSQKDLISISFFKGKDLLKSQEQIDWLLGLLRVMEKNQEDAKWKNTGFGLKWSRLWHNKLFSNLTIGYSNYARLYRSQLNYFQNFGGFGDNYISQLQKENQIKDFTLRLDMEYTNHPNGLLEFGFFSTYNAISNVESENELKYFEYYSPKGQYAGGYVQQTFSFFNRLKINAGLRNTFSQALNKTHLEPRFSLQYSISDQLKLKCASGKYIQFINQAETDIQSGISQDFWILADKDNISALSSWHFITGFLWQKNDWLLDVEAYHKSTKGLAWAHFDQYEIGLIPQWEFKELHTDGLSWASGLEILLQKTDTYYTSWVGYTLSRVNYQFPGSGINRGKPFSSNYDHRHEVKWAGIFQKGPWEFSIQWFFRSGSPYSKPTRYSISDDGSQTTMIFETKNRYRLPSYHRMDIACNLNFDIGKAKMKCGLSIMNLYDHKNIKVRKFFVDEFGFMENNTLKGISGLHKVDLYQLGITPSLFLEVKF
ncbi:carboxypeptidase-like regulatory domain-containing protein [Xanthovirga aplysinae]|uniref:carboxypeptidase-like regulatory domain-containing protein n=1 Tax=Xanthovirga aplysinae TaxID=2529853 RepID=UPI0012BD6319|nr:carboxypeptidase-like regulatory domain-containing protein [Xanthovirga aplysinae]MTI32229.1 hypothetical protein [Xanthovirga aplysinae]